MRKCQQLYKSMENMQAYKTYKNLHFHTKYGKNSCTQDHTHICAHTYNANKEHMHPLTHTHSWEGWGGGGLKTNLKTRAGRDVIKSKREREREIMPYIQVQSFPPPQQLHSDFRNFKKGVCQVTKIITADSKPDMGLFNTTVIWLLPNIPERR